MPGTLDPESERLAPSEEHPVRPATRRRALFRLCILAAAGCAFFVIAEVVLRLFFPQVEMFPRWEPSADYGLVLYKNSTMVHQLPGRWRFTYTINGYQYHGEAVPISNRYDKDNVVVLGDSYSFGQGVNDGEEYAAVLGRELKDRWNVINLGVGGWGLTQEIRRYYEFGILYRPKVVILQFCGNDVRDNITKKVTVVEDGKFVFQQTRMRGDWLKGMISRSWLQKSQLYNLIRSRLYPAVEAVKYREGKEGLGKSSEEAFYEELLETFAVALRAAGTRIILIAVNGELDAFPGIKAKVNDLAARKDLEYVEVVPWFAGLAREEYASPEGHIWGKKGHEIIAKGLARILRAP